MVIGTSCAQHNPQILKNLLLSLLPPISIRNNHLCLVQMFSIFPLLRRFCYIRKEQRELIATENVPGQFHPTVQIIVPHFTASPEVKMFHDNLSHLI